jgi:hypothetical protein
MLRFQGDILYKQRLAWYDPNNLKSWDPTLVNPCTWFHITCNMDNSVVRVYATLSFLPSIYEGEVFGFIGNCKMLPTFAQFSVSTFYSSKCMLCNEFSLLLIFLSFFLKTLFEW